MQGPWKYSLPISMSWLLCLAGHRYVLASCPDVTVTREVLRDGFHRDLLTKVELGTVDEDIGHCSVAIKEQLPAGLYVDPNELASLQQHNRTEALIVPDAVDVEAPEYLATDLVVLIYMKSDPRCTHCFQATLPVHCRYHRPTENDGRVPAALKNPEILIRCPETLQTVFGIIQNPISIHGVWSSAKATVSAEQLSNTDISAVKGLKLFPTNEVLEAF